MNIFVEHAYSISAVMLLILSTYVALFVLKRKIKKRSEGVCTQEESTQDIAPAEKEKPTRGLRAVRFGLSVLNAVAHLVLVFIMIYFDAGIEALLICLLSSSIVCLLGGGGV